MTRATAHHPACECRKCSEESQERALGYLAGSTMTQEDKARLERASKLRERQAKNVLERQLEAAERRKATPCPSCGNGVGEEKHGFNDECKGCDGIASQRGRLEDIGVDGYTALDVARKMKAANLWFSDY